MKMILLIPFEKIDKEILNYIKKKTAETFKCKVDIYKQISLPPCRKRNSQLNAQDFLPSINKTSANYGLGITKKDLYVANLNFVFGVAFGKAAIISLARLSADKKLFFSRAAKEAIHEIGHLYGLPHCENAKCVMHFSNCLADTDFKSADFCKKCENLKNKSL